MLIITGSDNNYVPGVMVLIASAYHHNPQARFAILDMGISPENRARLDALGQRLGAEVTRYEVSESTFDQLNTKRSHLTKSTFLRLLIPELLPNEERAIYMDCDMVVIDSLTELDEIPLADTIIAAVACTSVGPAELKATGQTRGHYVNAGLLVMNLPVWRRENIAQQCLDLITNPQRPLLFEDQSAINIVAKERTLLLPKRYNTPAAATEIPEAPAVIHYFAHNKPWRNRAFLDYLWHRHAKPVADLLPPRVALPLRRRLSELNHKRRSIMGLLLRNPKYLKRRALETEVEARLRAQL